MQDPPLRSVPAAAGLVWGWNNRTGSIRSLVFPQEFFLWTRLYHTLTVCRLTSSSAGTRGLEKSALDYHVHFFNKSQFKSTLTPLCYLLLSHNLSDFSSSLLFPPVALCASRHCFRIPFSFEFRFPLSVQAFPFSHLYLLHVWLTLSSL